MTKTQIAKEIAAKFHGVQCEVDKTALGKGLIRVTCFHGDCDRIGRFAMSVFPQVHTFYSCHEFRKGRVSIYLNA